MDETAWFIEVLAGGSDALASPPAVVLCFLLAWYTRTYIHIKLGDEAHV